MPFSPLHMGPGIVLKSALQRRFSLTVFGWSQIVIDIQPLVAMAGGPMELHGFSHTFTGATLIGAFCVPTGKFLSEWGLRLVGEARHLPISWKTACASSFIGTWSHILLDSIVHDDVRPLAPFTRANPLYGLVDTGTMDLACVAMAFLGCIAYFILERRKAARG